MPFAVFPLCVTVSQRVGLRVASCRWVGYSGRVLSLPPKVQPATYTLPFFPGSLGGRLRISGTVAPLAVR